MTYSGYPILKAGSVIDAPGGLVTFPSILVSNYIQVNNVKDSNGFSGNTGDLFQSSMGHDYWVSPTAAGLSPVVAQNDITGQTAAANLFTFTTTAGAGSKTYEVATYLTVTAISAGTILTRITFTDQNGAARTINLVANGGTSANITAGGYFAYPTVTIRAQDSTDIVVETTFSGVSIAYDLGGLVQIMKKV